MMAIRVLERVPVDQIQADARELESGRLLLRLVVGVFYAIGWVAGKASIGGRIIRAALRRGWRDARRDLVPQAHGSG